MGTQLKVHVKRTNPAAFIPDRATALSAGFDLAACMDKPISIRAGEKATLIPTGIAIYIGAGMPNVMGLILPRSGLGHKQGLVLGNTAGVIDADYQNEWFISAWNRGQQDEIIINPGERIAQVIFVPVLHPDLVLVDDFGDLTDRGMGGWGSTGVGGFKKDEMITFISAGRTGKSVHGGYPDAASDHQDQVGGP